MLWSLFLLYVQVEVPKYIKIRCWHLVFILDKAFLKIKKRSGTSVHAPFSAWFLEKKCSSHYILLTDQISLSDFLSFLKYSAIYVLQLFAVHSATSQILKLNLAFLSSRFPTWPKIQNKNANILKKKRAFHFLKRFQLSETVSDLRVDLERKKYIHLKKRKMLRVMNFRFIVFSMH